MAQFQLVISPLLATVFLLLSALVFFVWIKIKAKKSKRKVAGQYSAAIFGYSLMILAGFFLFISFFFLITG